MILPEADRALAGRRADRLPYLGLPLLWLRFRQIRSVSKMSINDWNISVTMPIGWMNLGR
jgi:hypothetical protein